MDAAQTEKLKALALAEPGIRTWQERMPEPWRENFCEMNCSPRPKKLDDCPDCISVRRYGNPVAARDAEIAELRAEVERLRADLETAVKEAWRANSELSAIKVAARAAGTEKDADRFRFAIALEDNAETLCAAVMNNAPDAIAIRAEFDAAISAHTKAREGA